MDSHAELRSGHVLGVAILFGLIHAVVDAACIALLAQNRALSSAFGTSEAIASLPGASVWDLYLIYNVLAFGTQFSIGAVADRLRGYRMLVQAALVLMAVAVAIGSLAPHPAIVLAGLGNAAFHVGAGAIVLRLSPNRAAAAGLFVAPGTLGVAAGNWCVGSLEHWPWLALGLLAVCFFVAWRMGDAGASRVRERPSPVSIGKGMLTVCVSALLLSIAVRSFVGLTAVSAYDHTTPVLWGLVIAAFAGKAIGGFVSDGLGWIKTSLLALLLSAPLLSFFVAEGPAAAGGMLLFQMTMPVTLLAMYRAFPREPGFAFGLTTLALLVGAIPVLVFPAEWLSGRFLLLALILTSAAALAVGLPPILRSVGSGNRSF